MFTHVAKQDGDVFDRAAVVLLQYLEPANSDLLCCDVGHGDYPDWVVHPTVLGI